MLQTTNYAMKYATDLSNYLMNTSAGFLKIILSFILCSSPILFFILLCRQRSKLNIRQFVFLFIQSIVWALFSSLFLFLHTYPLRSEEKKKTTHKSDVIQIHFSKRNECQLLLTNCFERSLISVRREVIINCY